MEPYVFVARPFSDHEAFFERVQRVVRECVKLACEDGKVGSSQELRTHVMGLIAGSELLIAEISSENPNVLYEVGFAAGIGKPTFIVVKKGSRIPADVQGLKRIEYLDLDDNFDASLAAHLKWEIEINSRVGLLRDMLEGPTGQPAFILSSPRYPPTGGASGVQFFDSRTFGDNLGVLGLISAFASMWGPGNAVELISAQYSPASVLTDDVNLYLIGSPKVNPRTEQALRDLHNGMDLWSFPIPANVGTQDDFPLVLSRNVKGTQVSYYPRGSENESPTGTRAYGGYGLLVRGPHPKYPRQRMITILAGARSIGTGAACLAATHPSLIQQIRSRLPRDADLSDKGCTFWALVYGRYSDPKRLLEPENVEIEEAGTLPRLS